MNCQHAPFTNTFFTVVCNPRQTPPPPHTLNQRRDTSLRRYLQVAEHGEEVSQQGTVDRVACSLALDQGEQAVQATFSNILQAQDIVTEQVQAQIPVDDRTMSEVAKSSIE